MQFLDLIQENLLFEKSIKHRLEKVMRSGIYLFGEQLYQFETRMKQISHRECVGVANATDGLKLALLDCWAEDMPIILPNFTALPTGVAAKTFTDNLFYVDVDSSLTIDTKKLPEKVKNGVVIAVSLLGNIPNRELVIYCKKNNHKLILDAAQSFYNEEFDYLHPDYIVHSFYPTKPLGCMGDGGCILVDSPEVKQRLERLRFYGQYKNIKNEVCLEDVGVNSRLSEVQAACLNAKIVDEWEYWKFIQRKKLSIQKDYLDILKSSEVKEQVCWNEAAFGDETFSMHQFVILCRSAEHRIMAENIMLDRKIPFMHHYNYHLSELCGLSSRHDSFVHHRVSDRVISIPCHSFLTESDQKNIAEMLKILTEKGIIV